MFNFKCLIPMLKLINVPSHRCRISDGRVYVNIADKKVVQVFTKGSSSLWPLPQGHSMNYPMALDDRGESPCQSPAPRIFFSSSSPVLPSSWLPPDLPPSPILRTLPYLDEPTQVATFLLVRAVRRAS